MQRRQLLAAGATLAVAGFTGWARAATRDRTPRLLVLIELRGGNDGLNTLVPVDDGRYYDLRPKLALRDDAIVRLIGGPALNAALAPWAPLWAAGEMALLQGVGYPQPDLSHFRSIEIWDTASDSNQLLQTGWLTRVAAAAPAFQASAADGVILGAADLGPLAGGARAVALADTQRFAQQARLAASGSTPLRGALAHVVQVENDIVRAGAELATTQSVATEFPRGSFGQAVRQASMIAAGGRVPVIRITLAGFDTHQNQLGRQAALLRELAGGVVALRGALTEAGVWQDTLVLTYSEFGRRARENGSGGTDHGTASVHFAFGPGVQRGAYGAPPALDRLDAAGNVASTLDFRSVYATVIERWWGLDAQRALGARYAPVGFLKAGLA
jgi:uncharacterized protein (DUF1501 family)